LISGYNIAPAHSPDRNGDTTPSLEAAFQAVSIYGLSEQTLSDKDAQSLKNWVLSQESNWINSASGLHYAAVVLKFVGKYHHVWSTLITCSNADDVLHSCSLIPHYRIICLSLTFEL
jgi:hypothetical protein